MDRDPQKELRYCRQIIAFKDIIESFDRQESLKRLLVFGCGNGLEAGYLHLLLGVEVVGVDIGQKFDNWAARNANLINYDGKNLPFPDGHFDAIYSFHVLEHVANVPHILSELRRVVHPNGFVYAGVPNKSRLIGYFGMNDKSFYTKLKANFRDYLKKMKGQWDNHLGAHAGFKERELQKLFKNEFSTVMSVTTFYYASKWRKYVHILRLMEKLAIQKICAPSVYILASD